MTDIKLLQQALDALEKHIYEYETIEAIKTRLAQPEPKPVGCITEVHTKTAYGGTVGIEPQMYGRLPVGTLIYTAPPKKEWVGLTDSEREEAVWESGKNGLTSNRYDVALAVEAKLKEKNT